MKKEINILLLTVLFFTVTAVFSQGPLIRKYTMDDGFPGSVDYHIFRDKSNFLWFSTNGGLVRFDGKEFKRLSEFDGLSYYKANEVSQDEAGRLWIMGGNGKLNFYYNDVVYNSRNAPFLDSLEWCWNFYQDEDKLLYFQKGNNVVSLDSVNHIRYYSFKKLAKIRHIGKSLSGAFLLWTDKGLYSVRKLTDEPVLVREFADYSSFIKVNERLMFVVHHNFSTNNLEYESFIDGVFNGTLKVPLPVPPEVASAHHKSLVLNNQECGDVFISNNGIIWIGTTLDGVFFVENNQVHQVKGIKGANSIAEDFEHNIWVGGYDGIFRINKSLGMCTFYDASHFQNSGIRDILTLPNGSLWLTNGKSLYNYNNTRFCSGSLNLKGNEINCLDYFNENQLIGYYQGAYYVTTVFQIDNIQQDNKEAKLSFRLNWIDESINPKWSHSMSKDRKHFSWLSWEGPVINTYSTQSGKLEQRCIKTNDSIILAHFNANDKLVITARKGHFEIDKPDQYRTSLAPLNGNIFIAHCFINDSIDVYRFSNDSIYLSCRGMLYNLSATFDLRIEEKIKARLTYQFPYLYFHSERKIYRCRQPLDVMFGKTTHVDIADATFNNISRVISFHDTVFVASQEGLTIIPQQYFCESQPMSPIPFFRSIKVNDKEVHWPEEKIQWKGKAKISFELGAISFDDQHITFAYSMRNGDTSWTQASTSEIVFQDLAPGEYTFLLRVKKLNSDWSKPIACSVVIRPTLWQHSLFKAFLFVLLTGIVVIFVIYRKNLQLRKKEIELQLVSLEQTALLSMMNPHFIFNVLGSIQSYMLINKTEDAGIFLSKFARLIRQNLNSIKSGVVSIEEEISRLGNYLDLEKLRMESKFDYVIEISPDLRTPHLFIPSMILQPFIENAILHGISSARDKGEILVLISRVNENSLSVIIEDNGIGVNSSVKKSPSVKGHASLGIEMTQKRLRLLGEKMGVQTTLTYEERDPGSEHPGTRVILVLPLIDDKSVV